MTNYIIQRIFVIATLVFIKTDCESVGYQDFFAHVIPLQNKKLDVTPLATISPSSRVRCLIRCALLQGCAAFNYGEDRSCELLPTYLCENTASLVAADGYAYYDVENSTQNIGVYSSEDTCQNEGKCSPKCPPPVTCVWSSEFAVTNGMYIVGYTKATYSGVTETNCMQRCVDATTFLCKSADYSPGSSKCYLSHLNKDDVPELYYNQASYNYLHRLCQ